MGYGHGVIYVECDKCEFVSDAIDLTLLAGGGWDARNVRRTLQRDGWIVEGNGDETFCPECAESYTPQVDSDAS